jgi:predicted heme/steroid binding protein
MLLYAIFAAIDRSMYEDLKRYSRAQLALRNGQDKPQIWCAYRGIIYDVSHSRLWKNGLHYQHWAGQDLTDELMDAPHSASVFERFEAVGVLDE